MSSIQIVLFEKYAFVCTKVHFHTLIECSEYKKMKIVTCSACKFTYDYTNVHQRRRHDDKCDGKKRIFVLNKLLEEQKLRDKNVDDKLRKTRNVGKRLNAYKPMNNSSRDILPGAYTTTMFPGTSTSDIQTAWVDSRLSCSHLNSKSDHVSKVAKAGTCKDQMIHEPKEDMVTCHELRFSINDEYGTCKETCDDGSIYKQWNDDEVSSSESIDGLSSSPDDDDEVSESNNVATFMNHDDNIFSEKGKFSSDTLTELHNNRQYKCDEVIFSRDETVLLELASILTSVNAPQHVYHKIFNWAEKLKHDDLSKYISYHSIIKRVADKYNMGNIFPKT